MAPVSNSNKFISSGYTWLGLLILSFVVTLPQVSISVFMYSQEQLHNSDLQIQYNANQIFSNVFHQMWETNPKFYIEGQNIPDYQSNPERKNNAGAITISDFKL